MPRLKGRFLVTAAALLALGGCDKVELFGLYVANLGTEAVVKSPWPIELPFEEHDGKIVVEASVNGSKPIGFLLDTSAQLVSLLATENTEYFHLNIYGAHGLKTAENPRAPYGLRHDGLEIDFGGFSLKNQTALALPASGADCDLGKADASPFGGVIGHDIFRRFVVEVDRDRSIVRLHDPDTYHYRGRGKVVPISFEERQPFVEALITPHGAPTYSARLQLDTGSDVEAAISSGSNANIVASVGTSSSCSSAREATSRPRPLLKIELADQVVSSAADYTTEGKVVAAGQNGRLGARFLARFNIVFDYPHERVILDPRSSPLFASGGADGTGSTSTANPLRLAS